MIFKQDDNSTKIQTLTRRENEWKDISEDYGQ